MASRGVHFALTSDEEKSLLAADSDDDLLELLDGLEERWDEAWLVETDTAWDAIHRCLGDGTLDMVSTPEARAVLGGRQLHEEDDYVVSYLGAGEVEALVPLLAAIDRDKLAARFAALADTDYDGSGDAAELEYTWKNFQALRELLGKAARAGRAVVFTVEP